MKFSTTMNTMKNSNALFCEQVETITSLFQNWNECEQTVVLYALLRGIPFQNLKFLQLCIEYNLQNITHSELKTLEQNANNPNYLRNLFNGCVGNDLTTQIIENENLSLKNRSHQESSYRNYGNLQKQNGSNGHMNYILDGPIYPNDKMQDFCNNGYQDSNLDYFKGVILPELLHCLPLLQLGNEEAKNVYLSLVPQAVGRPGCEDLCQQLLSYLLIHPAVSGEDRRSLTQYLHHLEEHISLGSRSQIPTQPNLPEPQIKPTNQSAWSLQENLTNEKPNIAAASNLYTSWSNFNPDYQKSKDEFRKTIGKDIPYHKLVEQNSDNNYDDDSQLSFSKNGTDIDDIATENSTQDAQTDFFSQNCKLYNVAPKTQESPIKTQRSSSLTPTSDDGLFRSNENLSLLTLMQKPRSYSLSSEHNALLSPHSSLISSGSESRLDDFKNTAGKSNTVKNAGMGNIAQWLKSLRLHKYIWLFSNTSYDEMMGITEEYLARLGVTKGARHKLYLSIQRLKERFTTLCNVERDLLASHGSAMFPALEEMRAIIMSPIKPQTDDDIVQQFLKVLDIVSSLINSSLLHAVHDEECLALYFWILDRAIGNEAFAAHVVTLKNMKFKTVKTNQYQSKIQYKNVYNPHLYMGRDCHRRNSDFGANGRNTKPRWNQYSNRSNRAVPPPPQWNSPVNQMNNYHNPYNMHALYNNNSKQTNGKPSTSSDNQDKYTKSSSYPNFHMKPEMNFEPHRHSLTSLDTPTNNSMKPGNSTQVKPQKKTESTTKTKSSVVEINNRLESLCLQMTEQAIE